MVEGLVSAIKPYGVFVTMNGVAGLLHISQISSDRVNDLEKVLPVGTKLKVMVVSQDASKGRLALSTKTLEQKPGQMLKDPQTLFDNAEETAAAYRVRSQPLCPCSFWHAPPSPPPFPHGAALQERAEAERLEREAAAQDVILGLETALSGADASAPQDAAEGDSAES